MRSQIISEFCFNEGISISFLLLTYAGSLQNKTEARAFDTLIIMTETKPDCFAAAFSYEGEHGYCFGHEDLLHLRWRYLPHELDEILTSKLQNPDKAKIAWLSIGLDSRYWIRHSDSDKWVNGMYDLARIVIFESP